MLSAASDLDRAVAEGFTWRDGDRTYRFGPAAIDDAPALLGDGYTLITTARSRGAAPALVGRRGAGPRAAARLRRGHGR